MKIEILQKTVALTTLIEHSQNVLITLLHNLEYSPTPNICFPS